MGALETLEIAETSFSMSSLEFIAFRTVAMSVSLVSWSDINPSILEVLNISLCAVGVGVGGAERVVAAGVTEAVS